MQAETFALPSSYIWYFLKSQKNTKVQSSFNLQDRYVNGEINICKNILYF